MNDSKSRYFEIVTRSIINDPDFKISEVTNIQYVKGLSFYHKYVDEIISILKNGDYEKLAEMKDDSESFDDISVIKFTGNNNHEFYGIVYDDFALETDPIVLRVFRSIPPI